MKTKIYTILIASILLCFGSLSATPLHDAVENADFETVKKLLNSKKKNVNAKEKDGSTPLQVASVFGETEIVKLLISKGANVNAKNKYYGSTPLHLAVQAGHTAIVVMLKQHGATR